MKKILLIFIFVFGILFAFQAQAADHYIRALSSGEIRTTQDGNSWMTAWTGFPTDQWGYVTFARGTYYVADGIYVLTSALDQFNIQESGTTYFKLIKATGLNGGAGHGSDEGWDNSYGDGQAVFRRGVGLDGGSMFSFYNGYYEFDGVNGSGTNENSYGFKFDLSSNGGYGSAIHAFMDNGWSDAPLMAGMKIKHCFFTQDPLPADAPTGASTQFIYFHRADNLIVSNNYFLRGSNALQLRLSDGVLLENNYFSDSLGNDNNHGEPISGHGDGLTQDNWTIRNNVFKNVDGTAVATFDGNQLDFYGNLIYRTNNSSASTSNGIVASQTGFTMTNVRIYNNTMVNLQGFSTGIGLDSAISTADVKNNIWYNCANLTSGAGGGSGLDHNYNWFGSLIGSNALTNEANGQYNQVNPFVDSANYDFRLKAHTIAGSNLGNLYNIDMLENVRTTWDRGAYEYTATQACTTPGDFTCNGYDANDIQVMINIILDIEQDSTKIEQAKMNTGDSVDATDLQLLINKVLGIN